MTRCGAACTTYRFQVSSFERTRPHDGGGASRLGGEMESPVLENGAPDKSRSEGNHTPAPRPKYKTGGDPWAFGFLVKCVAANRPNFDCVSISTGCPVLSSARGRSIGPRITNRSPSLQATATTCR
jgi:hypothetical protein